MFNASVRPSVCLKPKFGQLFDVSCLNLRGSAERTCNKKTKFGPTFYVLIGAEQENRFQISFSWDTNTDYRYETCRPKIKNPKNESIWPQDEVTKSSGEEFLREIRGKKISEALFFTSIYRGNSGTRTLWVPRSLKSKTFCYCLMPSVISTVICRGKKIFCFGVKNRGKRQLVKTECTQTAYKTQMKNLYCSLIPY